MQHLAGKDDRVGDAQLLCQLLQRLLFRSVPDDEQAHIACGFISCAQKRSSTSTLFSVPVCRQSRRQWHPAE